MHAGGVRNVQATQHTDPNDQKLLGPGRIQPPNDRDGRSQH